jgi:hypothetical protein
MVMATTDRSKKQAKTPYSAPTLSVYGSVTKLTAGGTGPSNEGSGSDPLKHP